MRPVDGKSWFDSLTSPTIFYRSYVLSQARTNLAPQSWAFWGAWSMWIKHSYKSCRRRSVRLPPL